MAKQFKVQELIISGKSFSVLPSDTGTFWRHDGTFANPLAGNPSGFLTSSSTGFYSGEFYPYRSNPSGYITSSQTGVFLTTGSVGGVRTIVISGTSISGNVTFTGAGLVSLTNNGNTITISGLSSTGAGEANTASNLGAGVGVYSTKVGFDLRFNTLSGVSGIVVENSGNVINIGAPDLTRRREVLTITSGYSRYNINSPRDMMTGFQYITTGIGTVNFTPQHSVWSSKNNIFCCVGYSFSTGTSSIYVSSNGSDWSGVSNPISLASMKGICYSNELDRFVALEDTLTSGNVITSPNGINWTQNAGSSLGSSWNKVCWSKERGIFVAVSAQASATNCAMTSPDGFTWTRRSTTVGALNSIVYADTLGLFIAVGGTSSSLRITTSPDGINWTTQTYSNGSTPNVVIWSRELGLLVMLFQSSTSFVYSLNGINWIEGTASEALGGDHGVWCAELGLFVAILSSRIAFSNDGITWSFGDSSPVASSWRGIAWSPELGRLSAIDSNRGIQISNINLLSDSIPHLRGRIGSIENITGTFITSSQTGSFYPTSNPSGYITSSQTGNFVTISQTGSFVTTGQTGILTGSFYPRNSNPSGYLTTANVGGVRTLNVTGLQVSGNVIFTGLGNINLTLSGSTISISGNTGSLVSTSQTGNFVTTSQTGNFYPTSNPSGYVQSSQTGAFLTTGSVGGVRTITASGTSISGGVILAGAGSISLSNNANTITISGSSAGGGEINTASNLGAGVGVYSTKVVYDLRFRSISGLGGTNVALNGDVIEISGNFVTASQTGNFVTTAQTGNFVTTAQTGNFVTTAQTGNFVTTAQTGNFITTDQTGNFYPRSNPSGYIQSSQTGGFLTTSSVGGVRTIDASGTSISGSVVFAGAGSITLSNSSNTITISGSASSNGATTSSKSITVENPTVGDKINMFYTHSNITALRVKTIIVGVTGGLTPSGTFKVTQSNIRTGTASNITNSIIETSQSSGTLTTSFANSTITGGNFVFWECSQSTNITSSHLTLEYN